MVALMIINLSQFLSEQEIFEASEAQSLYGPKVFNPQQQIPLGWSIEN